MRVVVAEVQRLVERIRDASRANFYLACTDLFGYLEERAPDNRVLLALNDERTAKWGEFPGPRPNRWAMPTSKADRESLAYDLFRSVGEQKEDGRGLLFHMYHEKFPTNVDRFRSDFLSHLADALTRILKEEAADVDAPDAREKQQKFGILDAPNLLNSDLEKAPGLFGRAVIYFDLDNFKDVNKQFTERVVDANVLPAIQRLVAQAVVNHGYAYAEGGDEIVVLLPNSTLLMGAAFARSLCKSLAEFPVEVNGQELHVTASFGVAAGTGGSQLADAANRAKQFAKENGRNCVAITRGDEFSIWAEAM